MKTKQAERMERIALSGIRKVFDKVGELEAKGIGVVHLEIGRPDFDTPVHIKEAAKKALDEGFVHYTPNSGVKELREAISEKLSRDNGIEVDPEKEIIVTTGTSEAIFISIMATLNPGDEVIVPDPMFVYYADWAEFAEAKTVPLPLREENGYKIDPEDIEKRITPHTKMLIINSPHNPTGCVFDKDTLEAIANIAKKHDLLVLSDEIYEKILYDGAKHYSIASFPGMKERTLTINGFSKAYSMTGWRIGYVATSEDLIPSLMKVHQHIATCATSFAQKGALSALTGSSDCVEEMVKEFSRRRKLVLDYLDEMEGVTYVKPTGAFYVFPSIKGLGVSDEEVADYLLKEARVAVVPGRCFGKSGQDHIRIAYSTSYDNLEKGLERMSKALRKIR
ncbi:pyridoxal phosphate-dependent aminotransferase [Candidatus Aerophobetes bacterium]|uniref:Aminotransferase n=1 Tax=Aerophobetes bacterium TaxID=2030807 RepID=A0A662DNK2_UNCAE|nr:MAG: pyridoxal phosphate-dependent aminotransferase [Candidatus Aerophobetes bacterium]